MNNCLNCNNHLSEREFYYSIENFNYPLCIVCQQSLREKIDITTKENLELYFALRGRGVPAELEKFDGYKTIDIAIVDARVNIEVDGNHHKFNVKQALSDLKRTYYSFLKGYLTLRIPNSLILFHLDETADMITAFLNENKQNRY